VIVPRTHPRKEQWIRARRAQELGLVSMLNEEKGELTPAAMAEAVRGLPHQKKPSEVGTEGLMGGLTYVKGRVRALLGRGSAQQSAAE
jgi:predicted glycosyltransferase